MAGSQAWQFDLGTMTPLNSGGADAPSSRDERSGLSRSASGGWGDAWTFSQPWTSRWDQPGPDAGEDVHAWSERLPPGVNIQVAATTPKDPASSTRKDGWWADFIARNRDTINTLRGMAETELHRVAQAAENAPIPQEAPSNRPTRPPLLGTTVRRGPPAWQTGSADTGAQGAPETGSERPGQSQAMKLPWWLLLLLLAILVLVATRKAG